MSKNKTATIAEKAFASALSELTNEIVTTNAVPHLGLEIELLPGEYWIFQPAWFNLRWWWDEIITQAELLYQLITQLTSFYLHKRALETLAAQEKETTSEMASDLSVYLSKISDEIRQKLEEA